jgi:hypothetical protein
LVIVSRLESDGDSNNLDELPVAGRPHIFMQSGKSVVPVQVRSDDCIFQCLIIAAYSLQKVEAGRRGPFASLLSPHHLKHFGMYISPAHWLAETDSSAVLKI